MGCGLTDGFIQQMLASVSHDLVGHAVSCNSHNTSVIRSYKYHAFTVAYGGKYDWL